MSMEVILKQYGFCGNIKNMDKKSLRLEICELQNEFQALFFTVLLILLIVSFETKQNKILTTKFVQRK